MANILDTSVSESPVVYFKSMTSVSENERPEGGLQTEMELV